MLLVFCEIGSPSQMDMRERGLASVPPGQYGLFYQVKALKGAILWQVGIRLDPKLIQLGHVTWQTAIEYF